MNESKRSLEERIKNISEINQRLNIQKLETDDQEYLLLDRNNPYHVAWYEDYDSELV